MTIQPRHRVPVRLLLGVGLLLAAVAPGAFAGALYRCNGPRGEIAYTNKPGGYANCVKVAGYADEAAKPAASGAVAATTSATTAPPAPGWNYREQPAEAAASVPAEPAPAAAPEAKEPILRGAVYKVTKANGVTEYTNIRPGGRSAYRVLFTYISTCFACDVHSSINFGSIALNIKAYRDEIAASAKEFGVDAALLRAVIHAESAFNPNAMSHAGAQGLMQLMPDTAGDLGVLNPFDAAQNIRGGAQYLANLLKDFRGDERLALAAYNAGPANVQKYGGVPPFDETKVYVDRVAVLRERYKKLN